jgi:hypothetical protein
MTSTLRTTAIAFAAVAGAALVPAGAATAASTCKLTKDEQYHRAGKYLPTYTRSLKVSGGVSCGTGHKFIKAYYKCRITAPSSGKKGRCTKAVMGFKCTERRFDQIKTQFDATATCRKGRAKIVTDYTQFT